MHNRVKINVGGIIDEMGSFNGTSSFPESNGKSIFQEMC